MLKQRQELEDFKDRMRNRKEQKDAETDGHAVWGMTIKQHTSYCFTLGFKPSCVTWKHCHASPKESSHSENIMRIWFMGIFKKWVRKCNFVYIYISLIALNVHIRMVNFIVLWIHFLIAGKTLLFCCCWFFFSSKLKIIKLHLIVFYGHNNFHVICHLINRFIWGVQNKLNHY